MKFIVAPDAPAARANSKTRLRLGLRSLLSIGALLTAAAAQGLAAAPPAGVSQSDWSAIRAEYERNRHATFPVDAERHARNHNQQWLSRFDGRGWSVQPDSGSWTWGLELESYGWAGEAQTVSQPAAFGSQNERVSYQWDARLEEWYVNDERGLEHGFTLREEPSGAGEYLEWNLAVRGGLDLRIANDGRSARFLDGSGAAAVDYAGLVAFDAAGRDLPARMERTADGLRLRVKADGAVYPITVDPIASQAYLKASNTQPGDGFGWAVAIQGNTIVVTAPGEDSAAVGVNGNQADNSAVNSGAAYVFVRSGATWVQQAYLKPSNTDPNDAFGLTAAISEDTIAIGAPAEDSASSIINGAQGDNTSPSAGAVYVFVRNNGVWTQQAYIKAPNPDALDSFGTSLDLSGNILVVGAPGEDSTATGVFLGPNTAMNDNGRSSTGAAYSFMRNGGAWSFHSYIKASNTGEGDAFGSAVAISRDTIVVGAPAEDSNSTMINGDQADNSAASAGAAYVFSFVNGQWSQQAYLKAPNAEAIDTFGIGVDISGDLIVVGARGEDSSAVGVNGNQADNLASASGAAYVFRRQGGVWSNEAYLKASNTEQFDLFGDKVAISADSIVVTATGEDSALGGTLGNPGNNASPGAGAAYVFQKNAGVWSQQGFLKASNANPGDMFGGSAAISPLEVLVGATMEDSNSATINFGSTNNDAIDAGAAYVFNGVNATPAAELGVFINGSWFIDRDGDFTFDPLREVWGWGSPGDTPIRGDWNGDGFQDLGVYSNGVWFVDSNGDGIFDPATDIKGWGVPGWIPVVGDWNGDRITDLGVVDPATMIWYRDLNGDFLFDAATEISSWGSPGDTPIVGDWNSDGISDLGVVSGATWLLDLNGNGAFDPVNEVRGWGVAGWTPVIGDWDGDGGDELGMVDPATSTWFRDLDGNFAFDPATEILGWGTPGDTPVVGDWNGDGKDDVAVFSNGIWFIDLNGDQAFDQATDIRAWGVAGWTPLPGSWQ